MERVQTGMAQILAPADRAYFGPDRGDARVRHYWLAGAALLVAAFVPLGVTWSLTIFSHAILETIATTVAFAVGVLALVRHFSRPSGRFLFIGTGFLGTAIFDGIHTVVSIADIAQELPSGFERVSLWSWLASRLFLGMLMVITAIRVGPYKIDDQGNEVVDELPIFASVGVLIAFCLILFWTAPLPDFIYSDMWLPRPLEIAPALLFLLSFVVLFRTGVWRTHAFSHWLMLSLLVNFAVDGLLTLFSDRIFNTHSVMAHYLKVTAYALVFAGLANSLHDLVRQAEDATSALETANRTLALEVEERRQTEALLRTSELHLAEAQHLARIGHWELEPESGRILLSTELSSILGLPARPHRLALSELLELVAADQRAALQDALRSAQENATPFELELRINRSEGEPIQLGVLGNTMAGNAGAAARLWGTGQDITERYRTEEQLRTAATRLEASNRELQDFAYIASHDLQEPLRKIIAFSDRLASKFGGQLDETGHDYLQRVQHAARRMQVLIEDLLTLSRVTTRGQPFVDVNLYEIIQGVAADLETRLEETNGTLEIGDLPVMEADPLQMRQLFQNLIGNALKFHRPDAPPYVRVWAEKGACDGLGNRWKIMVEDNGIGFEMKYAERIFQPFQRLHGRSSDYAGTGMGLAICRKIVERHHGSIEAESEPNRGTTFSICLPEIQQL
jgi:signal transduction histidine kinase